MSEATSVNGFRIGSSEQSYRGYTGTVKFYGSNDGTTYTLLGTAQQKSSGFALNPTRVVLISSFDATDEYSYFRLTLSNMQRGTYGHFYDFFPSVVNTNELDPELHLDAASFPQKGESGYSNTPATWTALTGSNGTITGATFDSELGNYLNLSSDNTYIDVPTANILDSDFTIEMWYNLSSTSNYYKMLLGGSNYQSGTGLGHYVYGDTVKTWVSISGTTTNVLTSSNAITANKWHHIVLKRQGSNWTQYVDGDEVGTATGTTSALSSPNSRIGRHYNATGLFAAGKSGQVRIYSSALTQDKIRQNYNFTKNDYPNGFDAVNSSNPASFVSDYFDFTRGSVTGGSDQMIVDSSIHSLLNSLDEYTFTAWYYPDNLNGRNVIFGTGHTSDNNDWVLFRVRDNNTFEYNVQDAGTNYGAGFPSGSSGLNDQWNFIACTVHSDGTVGCRTNGTSYNPTYVQGSTAPKFSDVDWNVVTIGSFDRGSSGQYYDGFDGRIGQIRLYSRALTTSEIDAIEDLGR